MRMTMDDLTVDFTAADQETLLEDWWWLIGRSRVPILVTASGDAFVQDATDGSVHLLDTTTGTLDGIAGDEAQFRALLADHEFVANHLAVQRVGDLVQAGVRLAPGQVYGWRKPPVLGGAYEPDNVEPTDVAVHFSLTGQIHEQVRNRPAPPAGGGADGGGKPAIRSFLGRLGFGR